jgi:hypothetical protein
MRDATPGATLLVGDALTRLAELPANPPRGPRPATPAQPRLVE